MQAQIHPVLRVKKCVGYYIYSETNRCLMNGVNSVPYQLVLGERWQYTCADIPTCTCRHTQTHPVLRVKNWYYIHSEINVFNEQCQFSYLSDCFRRKVVRYTWSSLGACCCTGKVITKHFAGCGMY